MRSRGFTLIELLVVMLIIGVIISLATLAMRDERSGELEREARRLTALLQLASDEAVLASAPVGVRFFGDGYTFMRLAEGEWRTLEDDRQLRPRELPAPLRLSLVLEDQPLERAERSGERPQIVLVSSGELEPAFEVSLSHPDLARHFLIVGRRDGRFEFQADEPLR